MNAEFITYHNTANDASADSEIRYMNNNNNSVSYHFAIDDKEVVQGVPVNRNAWHCGDGNGKGNRKSIGVEVCYSKSGGDRYHKAEKLANIFVAQLLHKRGWSTDRVKPHQHWSGKFCPHRILSENRWNATLQDIQQELNKLNSVKTSSKPTQTSKPVTNLGLVDYMASKKMDSSFANRAKLATQYGIKNYKGTAEQNALLLTKLQASNTTTKPKDPVKTKEELSVSEAKKLQTQIDELNKVVKTKQNIVSGDTPDPSHAESWKWLKEVGLTNGQRPHEDLTREQFATILKRFYDLLKK